MSPPPDGTTGAQQESSPPPNGGRKWSAAKIFNLVALVVGAIALAWMMRHIGWAELRGMLAEVGAWAWLIIVLDLIALGCDAAALHTFMRPEARMISYPRVLAAQTSGRAINVLTPGGGLGEVTKLTMLTRHAPRARVLSSLVLANLAAVYLSVAVMLIGTPLTLLLVDLPSTIKVAAGIGLAVLVPAMVALGMIVHRGALGSLVSILRLTRILKRERAQALKKRLVEIDRHIRELQRDRTAGTWKGILWVIASKLVTYASTIVLLHAAGIGVSVLLVIGVLSVGVLIQWISSIIPMGLGLADGGNYALFGMLGATGPQGVLVTMMNRARSVAVALLGIVVYAGLEIEERVGSHRIRRKIVELKEANGDAPTS